MVSRGAFLGSPRAQKDHGRFRKETSMYIDRLTTIVVYLLYKRAKSRGVIFLFNETQNLDDMYAFRTPALLNVSATGPWEHSGAFELLEEIVRHHLDVEKSVISFDYQQISQSGMQTTNAKTNTRKAVNQLLANRVAFKPSELQNIKLSNSEVNDLLALLEKLTDPCIEDRKCVSSWIADENDLNPDNLRLIAVDAEGNLL